MQFSFLLDMHKSHHIFQDYLVKFTRYFHYKSKLNNDILQNPTLAPAGSSNINNIAIY